MKPESQLIGLSVMTRDEFEALKNDDIIQMTDGSIWTVAERQSSVILGYTEYSILLIYNPGTTKYNSIGTASTPSEWKKL